jgi:uncharacterized protein YndB with AHSA1/START domain
LYKLWLVCSRSREKEKPVRSDQALSVARRYHQGWTSKNYEQAIDLLSPTLEVEVPINEYPTPDSFARALRSFGDLVTSVDMISEMSDGEQAMVLYDMQVQQLGTLRVAEHFTVTDGKIARLRQIHDTAPIRTWSGPRASAGQHGLSGVSISSNEDYTREAPFAVAREAVYAALTTLGGLAGWWTPLVGGTPTAGREVEFAFAGLDQKIVMRVDNATPPSNVTWTCLTHTGHPEWQGTTIFFELAQDDDGSGLLKFRHAGLNPTLDCYETCEIGWEHFLASLLSYAEHGRGSPF